MLLKTSPTASRRSAETRQKLVLATVGLVLKQGFAGTTVDQICAAAGVTKGAFFHHFESKEAVGQAALDCWGGIGTSAYEPSWSDPTVDPLEQLHRHLDIMIELARREGENLSCVVGMMSQEISATNPPMRASCERELTTWNVRVAKMLADAKQLHKAVVDFDPESVAWMLNSLWQGSMLIGKARKNPAMIVSNLQHGKAYVDSLFGRRAEAPQRAPGADKNVTPAPDELAMNPYQIT